LPLIPTPPVTINAPEDELVLVVLAALNVATILLAVVPPT